MASTSATSLNPVIHSRDELPPFAAIISRPGILDISPAHHDDVILVGDGNLDDADLTADNLKAGALRLKVFWIVSPNFRNSLHLRSYRERLRKYRHVTEIDPAVRLATPEVIRSLHEDVLRESDAGSDAYNITETTSLFKRIAHAAYEQDASDVHIHVTRERAYILVRVNGEIRKLQDLRSPDFGMSFCRTIYQSLADESSRSKSVFDPRDYAEARVEVVVKDVRLSFRYQHSPVAPEGLNVVMRLIVESSGTQTQYMPRTSLGYSRSHDEEMELMFSRSTGLVLVCGVVGSGKSTTLRYETMKIIRDREGICVRTIEDPVEYIIPGVPQIPVEGDFNAALKACLRMDNNVIMVGEIRDTETASIVVDAVLTGHQILSTLHTASALEAVPRLRKLGVDAMTIGQRTFLSGLVYQRLLPVLCDQCAVPLHKKINRAPGIDGHLLKRIYHAVGKDHYRVENYRIRGRGCSSCGGSGIARRVACAETVVPTEAIREAWSRDDDRRAESLWRAQWRPTWKEFSGKTAFEHAVSMMRHGTLSPLDIERSFHRLDAAPGFDQMAARYYRRRGRPR